MPLPLRFDTPLHFLHLALQPERAMLPDDLERWFGDELRAELWRRFCAMGTYHRSCAGHPRAGRHPACAQHPDDCLAHALMPLSGQSNRMAWLSPALHVKPVLGEGVSQGIRLSLTGHFRGHEQNTVATDVVKIVIDHAARSGWSLRLQSGRSTTLEHYAKDYSSARRWRIEFLTPWLVEKLARPSISLESRANAIALAISQRVRRYVSVHLWSLRRAELEAADGTEAREIAGALEAEALGELSRLHCVAGELSVESVPAERGRLPRQQFTGWLELALPGDVDMRRIPLWLAMVDVIGLGQGTAKSNGAVRITAVPALPG